MVSKVLVHRHFDRPVHLQSNIDFQAHIQQKIILPVLALPLIEIHESGTSGSKGTFFSYHWFIDPNLSQITFIFIIYNFLHFIIFLFFSQFGIQSLVLILSEKVFAGQNQ